MFSKITARLKTRFSASVDVAAGAAFAEAKERGDACVERTDFAGAVRFFAEASAFDPSDVGVLNKLGFCLGELARHDDALQQLQAALALAPDSAETHYLLANLQRARGLPEQALDALRRVLACDPQFELAYRDICFLLVQSGQLQEAKRFLQQALQHFPQSAEFHFYLGNLYHEEKDWAHAEAAFRSAVAAAPAYTVAYFNLSVTLQEQGKLEPALAAIDQALAGNPDAADWHVQRGYLLQLQSRFDEAFAEYGRAIVLQPQLARAHANLGSLYEGMQQLENAVASYRQAVLLDPDNADFHFNLGSGLVTQGERAAGIASYRLALQINPAHFKALSNLAASLFDPEEALACYSTALQYYPEQAQLHVNRAYLLLKLGRYREGWREYEYRWQTDDAAARLAHPQPLWLGEQDVAGKTMLLYGEQGFGDMLHFVRYASLVAARGATVYLLVPAALKSLVQTCAGVSAVFSQDEELPPFDYLCPLMSLPLACGTELASVPAQVPYLHSDPVRVENWQKRLGEPRALRVGLAWAGDPRKSQPLAALMDQQRSMHFAQLLPLLDVPGVEFFSLQLGEARHQMEGPAVLRDFSAELQDFQDTAGLIENLDLVISVDTSIVHLAGALARPVWMMDRVGHCYRWLSGREDSPWYPSLRIFRQQTSGDWRDVVDRVKLALEQLSRSHTHQADSPA